MEHFESLELITKIATVITPVVLVIISAIGWKLRQSLERKNKLEEKLHGNRIEIYNRIIEPFIYVFMTDEAWNSDPKNKKVDKDMRMRSTLLSVDYRRTCFELSLIASDNVVLAYNNLMQHFFHTNPSNNSETYLKESSKVLGIFLLEIRRSMGNESTKLDCWEMLRWFFTDIDKIRD